MIYCIDYSQSTLFEVEHVAFHMGLWMFHTRASLSQCSFRVHIVCAVSTVAPAPYYIPTSRN